MFGTLVLLLHSLGSVHLSLPSRLQGDVPLRAEAGPPTARVDFLIGSHVIASAAGPFFEARWNSAEALDGDSQIRAVAFAEDGRFTGAAIVSVTIANHGIRMSVTAPDLTRALSGTVPITVTAFDPAAFPAIWTLNVDGEAAQTVWTDNAWKNPHTVTFQIDTTLYPNGPHELHISMNSRSGPENPKWINWRAMVNRIVVFSNGAAPMEIEPDWQHVYLAAREERAIGCRSIHADGTESRCGSPLFESSDPSIVSVSSSGVARAQREGFATLTVRDGKATATTQIWVRANSQIPHFSGSGGMLTRYTPGLSLFVVAPFFLEPDDNLARELHRDGINTLSFGMYLNAHDLSMPLSAWKDAFNATIQPKLDWAKRNGFHLLLTGDDIFRRPGDDGWFTFNWSTGHEAVAYAAHALAASGVAIGVEGIDEASALWGRQPLPNKPAICQGQPCFPLLPLDALPQMRSWMAEGLRTVPIAFPPLAADSPEVQSKWMGKDGISDYASHYFTALKTRTTYPWATGIQEIASSMRQAFYARQPRLMLDRPQMMLVSLAGPEYRKRAPRGRTYQPGVDELIEPGMQPETVIAAMMIAAELGGAGERLYYFDSPNALESRQYSRIGRVMETGSNPINLQTLTWRSMSYAANLLTHVLQPFLLDRAIDSPALGRNIVTAARESRQGRLLLITNASDWPQQVRPNLAAYMQDCGATRYWLHTNGVTRTALPQHGLLDTPTLGPGESLAYIFPAATSPRP